MPLGGSITHGIGSSNGNGYRERLETLLKANNYSVAMVGTRSTGAMKMNSHEGWRGYRIDQVDKKARQCVEKLKPNLFTLNAGSNDCLQDFHLEMAGSRMEDLLEYLWATASGSTVILSTLVVNRDPGVNSRIIAVNDLFRKLAEQKVARGKRIVLADMYAPRGLTTTDLGEDGTHPGDVGYGKMADIWFEAIVEAVFKGFLDRM